MLRTSTAPEVTTSPEAPTGLGAASATNALLVVDDVAVSYRSGTATVRAVEGVSFEMGSSERLMVLGPSGCGKSTLLRTIAGFQAPTRGTITFDGRAAPSPGPDRAVVFQEFDQLFPWQTVLNNVVQPLRHLGMGRAEARERAEQQLEVMGLADVGGRHPHQLSGGMKQRVAIARALALRPRMLLMDEPFGSLDAITRARLQEEVRQLSAATEVAVLFVTHSIDEALTVGDRVLVMSRPPESVRALLDVPPPDAAAERLAAAEQLQQLLTDPPPAPETAPETAPR